MKDKIVIWARDEEDKKVLLAIQLESSENQIKIYSFPESIVTEDFHNQLMNTWKNGQELAFVDGYKTEVRPLSMTDDLLPENLKVDRPDIITRAKAEWHFVVLSAKLYELYNSELSDIKDKVDKMEEYSSSLWEEMKGFWDKVQSQVREKNLFRDHANDLKESTNKLFDTLKAKRKEMDAKFREESKAQVKFFNDKLAEMKTKIDGGKSLQPIFEELKNLQSKFTKTKFSREDRNKLWNKIDATFKEIKEKKYGKSGGNTSSALTRLKNRYDGLMKAIDRMKSSIERDLRDKQNQSSRADNAGGQLEAQLRQAKIMMIDERISSKQVKMKDMIATKKDLENKIAKEEAREAKRKQDAEIKALAAEKKAEIKEQIAANTPDIDPEQAAKLEAAAKEIKESKAPRPTKSTKEDVTEETTTEKSTESTSDKIKDAVEDVVEDVSEIFEDVVDTVKAFASVAKDKAKDMVEKLQDEEE